MVTENSICGRERETKVILDISIVMLKYAARSTSGVSAMSGPGRPTLYKPGHASRARELCARGATSHDLAGRFGVARSTIGQWIATHPEFAEAVQQGRDVADAAAVESLFMRVTGYNHPAEKVFLYRGEPRTAIYTAHVPPETRACMF